MVTGARRRPARRGRGIDDEEWTEDDESCDSRAMPEPTPERRPNDQEQAPKPEGSTPRTSSARSSSATRGGRPSRTGSWST